MPKSYSLLPETKYAYCNCKQSSTFPMCDGTHRGSGMKPTKFFVEEEKEYFICNCGKSKTLPFCDGSHTAKS